MMTVLRRLVFALGLACLYIASADAASFRTQAACPPVGGDACVSFGTGTALPITVRSFTFNVPNNTLAAVSFEGSMRCAEVASAQTVVELTSQIVGAATTVPNFNGLSGLRHSAVLAALGTTVSFNLASSRMILYVTGGNKTVHFRIGGEPLGDFISCTIHNAQFNVILLP
jgi:hypothetical protein